MMSSLSLTGSQMEDAHQYLSEFVQPTPLLNLSNYDGGKENQIHLKVESLLPTGSFKVRAAQYALQQHYSEINDQGVWTVSAGNMGKALAWCASQKRVPCTVVVPDDAPLVKVQAIRRYGANIIEVSFQEYQDIQINGKFPTLRGKLIHPFADPPVIAADATIAWEILEAQPDLEVIFVPYGGGGLTLGVAQAAHAFNPQIHVIPCEVETATPLTSSLAAGKPVLVDYTPSFISGIGAPFIFPQMWLEVQRWVNETCVVTLAEVCQAMRWLSEEHHLIVEGAGAVSLAAALKNRHRFHKSACILTGGNIDWNVFLKVMIKDI